MSTLTALHSLWRLILVVVAIYFWGLCTKTPSVLDGAAAGMLIGALITDFVRVVRDEY